MSEGIGNTAHLLAACLWVGALGLLTLVVVPASRRTLDAEAAENLGKRIARTFLPLALGSAGVLLATGFMMTGNDPHFDGWGNWSSMWAKLMVAKHALYAGMVAATAVAWRLSRTSLNKDVLDICFYLGVAVLVVTGFVTAIP